MKTLAILGSTGSIGRSCLEVVAEFPERFRIASLAAGENVSRMAAQVAAFRPAYVSLATEKAADELTAALRANGVTNLPQMGTGTAGMIEAATLPEVDIVLSAAMGVAGLPATYAALCAGKTVALANKEVLVAAGELMTSKAREMGTELLPVDSEHNGVHQCLRGGARSEARTLVLTASGGPFLRTPAADLERVTVEAALRHPTWQMGRRITIDSATLVNKGFEVIEAHWLFGFSADQIKVKIHPQSTVHSLVEFVDGSVLAQLSITDMKIPIQYALTYPERVASNIHGFDWASLRTLEFEEPDTVRFPSLRLAYQALKAGGGYGCALNAADEIAVEAFLKGEIPFTAIPRLIEDVLGCEPGGGFRSPLDVLECDRISRERARSRLRYYRV